MTICYLVYKVFSQFSRSLDGISRYVSVNYDETGSELSTVPNVNPEQPIQESAFPAKKR